MKEFASIREIVTDKLSLYCNRSSFNSSSVKSLSNKYEDGEATELTISSNEGDSILDCCRLSVNDKGTLIDNKGRAFVLKGINLDASSKLPTTPDMPSYMGSVNNDDNIFFDGDNVSFSGRPFPLKDADIHFQRIKSWGYNTIRYIITWEAIEHSGPGIYDEDFIDYTIQILKVINHVGGLYIFFDIHQDVWSRFCGGSGAPMWTLYAAGLEPKRFACTEAAIFHNDERFQKGTEKYPKMIWTTNYKRLATMTMFTLFFAGKNYFPNLILNGKNIQDYLQDHYFGSMSFFWEAVKKGVPEMFENGSIIGFESLNEPNHGLMGHENLDIVPPCQHLRVGSTPSAFQTMKLGMGFPCMVDVYKISITGPQKYGSKLVDPQGRMAWLSPEEALILDKKYNWVRGSKWIIGKCIFAQQNIWAWKNNIDFDKMGELTINERLSLSDKGCKLLRPSYFSEVSPGTTFPSLNGDSPKIIDTEYFINNNFVEFYLKHKRCIRSISPESFVFIQPPVLEVPPKLKDDKRKIVDSRTIYSPHYYDGMSLMFKTWNTKYNVDTLGIMRGRYYNPILGIVFGERAIRNCIKKQFNEMKGECHEYLGKIPILMSETGMPFDMDRKRAYEDGKFQSQTAALDAISFALEGSNMSHTYWCYSSINCHKWGDRWNNEDFSFWSPDDRHFQSTDESTISRSLIPKRSRESQRGFDSLSTLKNSRKMGDKFSSQSFESLIAGHSEEEELDTHSVVSSSLVTLSNESINSKQCKKCYPSPDGVRAVNAVIRPYVVAACGEIVLSEFDLKSVKFSLTIKVDGKKKELMTSPTVIFVPKWHFPLLNCKDIYLSSGYVKYNDKLEYLEWFHDEDTRMKDAALDTSNFISSPVDETIIIKNNSGSLPLKEKEQGMFPCSGDLECPVT